MVFTAIGITVTCRLWDVHFLHIRDVHRSAGSPRLSFATVQKLFFLHHFTNTVRILSPLVAVLTSDGHWLNGCACSTSNFHRPVGVDLNKGTVESGQDSDKVQQDIDAPGHPSHKGNMMSILYKLYHICYQSLLILSIRERPSPFMG